MGDGVDIRHPKEVDPMIEPDSMVSRLVGDPPDPAVADRYRLFGRFIGSWDLEVIVDPEGPNPRRSRGRWDFGWILAGRAIQDVLLTESPSGEEGRPIADRMGTSIRAYDPILEAWWIAWMAPGDREFSTLLAREDSDGIVIEGQWSVGGGNTQGDLRFVWSFAEITPESFRWRGRLSADGGKTWRLAEEMRARRRHDDQPGSTREGPAPDGIPSSDFSHVSSVSSTLSVPVRIRMVPCTRLGGTPTSP
jgi:hypothetical protein